MFFKRKPKYDGLIGFYGLSEWWHESLAEEEKEIVLEKYSRYNTEHRLIDGPVDERAQTARMFLAYLAPWFSSGSPSISIKMMEKAEELLEPDLPLVKRVIFLNQCIEIFSKDKDSPERLPRLERVSKELMSILPDYNDLMAMHGSKHNVDGQGLWYLTWAFKQAGKYSQAADIACLALAKNWPGDWSNELEIITKKAASK